MHSWSYAAFRCTNNNFYTAKLGYSGLVVVLLTSLRLSGYLITVNSCSHAVWMSQNLERLLLTSETYSALSKPSLVFTVMTFMMSLALNFLWGG